MKNKRKIIIVVLSLSIILSVAFVIYKLLQPLVVNTVKLEKTNYEEYYFEEGIVQAQDNIKVYNIVDGNILKINIREGDVVKQGDLLLTINPQDLEYKLKELKAQKKSLLGDKLSQEQAIKNTEISAQKEAIKIAENTVSIKDNEFKRYEELFKSGAVSKATLEQIEQALIKSRNELKISRYKLTTLIESSKLGEGRADYFIGRIETLDIQIEQIENQIKESSIVAPTDGIISNFSLTEGDYINKNQVILEIFSANDFEIEAFVPAKEIRNIGIGTVVYIEIEGQNEVILKEGLITFIAPNAVDLISPLGLIEKKVKIKVQPKEEIGLIQGEKVDIKIVTYYKDNVYVISKDFIFPWMDGEGMWIYTDGIAKIIPIEKEFSSSSIVILKESIDDNIEIIVPPYPDKIKEGITVKTIE